MPGRPIIQWDKCKGCELCTTQCPKNILVMSKETNSSGVNYAVCIDEDKCTGCKLCAIMCPDNIIDIIKLK